MRKIAGKRRKVSGTGKYGKCLFTECLLKVSQQVLEWQAEAEVKTRRAVLLRALEKRCRASVPNDLAELIVKTENMDLLSRWFDAALDATNYDDFRKAVQTRP